jgi:Tol biopolymer transport system component
MDMNRLVLVVILSMGLLVAISSGAARASQAIAISPAEVTLGPGETVTFVATVSGHSNRAIRWSVKEGPGGGSITADGIYTASETPGVYHVVARSRGDHEERKEYKSRGKDRDHEKHEEHGKQKPYAEATITVEQPLRSPTSLERVSLSTDGVEANGPSARPALSDNGRFVAFESGATNLVVGDSNGVPDIFLRDLYARTTTQVSLTAVGGLADGGSYAPAISADGRYVAFESDASNLVSYDTNGVRDIFVKDVETGTVMRVSVSSSGEPADAPAFHPAINADGRFVAFHSSASNLVPDDTNGMTDVFVHDRDTGETTRVSITSTGEQGDFGSLDPAISADGRHVAFLSSASNLGVLNPCTCARIVVRDRQAGTTTLVVMGAGMRLHEPAISGDGRYVTFAAKSNTTPTRVAFYDQVTKTGTGIGYGDNENYGPSVNSDGRFVAFISTYRNSENAFLGVIVYKRDDASLTNVSVNADGRASRFNSNVAISGDGSLVAFSTDATFLVPDDTNGVTDIFVNPVP